MLFWRSEEGQKTVRGTVFPADATHAAPPGDCLQSPAGQWLADAQAQLVQRLGHARATVAAQTQAVLITDMGQKHPVASRPVRRWPRLPRPEPALCHAHQGARMAAGQTAEIVGNILKLQDFLDAKTVAACFGTALHAPEKQSPGRFSDPAQTRRMRVSWRDRSFSRETPRHPVRAPWRPRENALTHLPGVGCPIPKSDTT